LATIWGCTLATAINQKNGATTVHITKNIEVIVVFLSNASILELD